MARPMSHHDQTNITPWPDQHHTMARPMSCHGQANITPWPAWPGQYHNIRRGALEWLGSGPGPGLGWSVVHSWCNPFSTFCSVFGSCIAMPWQGHKLMFSTRRKIIFLFFITLFFQKNILFSQKNMLPALRGQGCAPGGLQIPPMV